MYIAVCAIHIRKPCLHFIHKHSGLLKLSWLTKNLFLMKQQYQFSVGPSLPCSILYQLHTKETKSTSHSTHRLCVGRYIFNLKKMSIPLHTEFSMNSVVRNRSSNKLWKKKTSVCLHSKMPLLQY